MQAFSTERNHCREIYHDMSVNDYRLTVFSTIISESIARVAVKNRQD